MQTVRYIHITVPHQRTQFCTTISQSPHWLQWDMRYMPNIYPQNCPFPSTIFISISYTHLSTNPTHNPKRHRDSISRFATI